MSAKKIDTNSNNSTTPDDHSFFEGVPDLSTMKVSVPIFYGVFLGTILLLSGLILGGTRQVQAVAIPVETIPLSQIRLERDVAKMVKGYPIEEMLPYITKHDRDTAAFIVGIAKKESNWGKRIPVTENGEDCYNYWGYRGEGSRGIAMGHGCFGSKKEAVKVISARIDALMHEYQRDTAQEMIVWKCGYSCDAHSSESVEKWISDVGYYADQIQKE